MSEQRDPSSPAPETLPYRRDGKGRSRVFRLITVGMGVVCLILAAQLILPGFQRTREPPYRLRCASNMKMIGLGAILYANSHGGQFPDDLDTIMETQDLTPRMLMCPMTAGNVPTAPTTREVVAEMRKLNLIAYVYVGKGLKVDASADTVIAYERPGDHGDGMNVLFADGHVEYLEGKEAQVVLGQVEAEMVPILYPLPETAATKPPLANR
jgi:prepilin-type processing-associated H-X9-DG protein